MITVGTAIRNIAAVIRRFRPTISASTPVNGAVSAIAPVPAVISAEISPAPTWNSLASSGSSACGEYRLTKAQNPAVATPSRRGSKAMRVLWRRRGGPRILDRLPHPIGRARRVDVTDAQHRQRIDDSVDAGGQRADGAGFA